MVADGKIFKAGASKMTNPPLPEEKVVFRKAWEGLTGGGSTLTQAQLAIGESVVVAFERGEWSNEGSSEDRVVVQDTILNYIEIHNLLPKQGLRMKFMGSQIQNSQ